MLQTYNTKSVLVWDNGLFVELAVLLSKHFGKVYYTSPWKSAFPKSNSILIGTGIPGVERVNNPLELIDDIDLWVFPDCYDGETQTLLESLGKRVFGSRHGDELELYRKEAKEHFKRIGIDIGPYEVVTGIDDLRTYLKENDDQYVKISFTRGDFETFHSPSYKLIEPKLDELEHTLGAKKLITEFIIDAPINDAIECGYDGYCIDGQFPNVGMCGVEIKDRGYISRVCDYSKIPKEITSVNDKLSDTLRQYRYRNFMSTEIRVTEDHTPYFIDACQRAGSPPSEIYMNQFENMPDIIWFGAEGKCIDPEYTKEYGAQALIISSWADSNWQAISFPEEIRDSIKLRNLTIIDGEYYVVPHAIGMAEIGSVVALGDSKEEAMENVKELCKDVKGYYIEIHDEALAECEEEIEKLKSIGIEI